MMEELCTVDEVKMIFRISTSDDDAMIQLLIEAASARVITHLKGQAETVLGSGDPPADVKMATIILVGYWYRNPDRDPDQEYQQGFLPRPVTALLYPYRDPALR
jgi:uncharacterized phage protein (predicted DNA packaging)